MALVAAGGVPFAIGATPAGDSGSRRASAGCAHGRRRPGPDHRSLPLADREQHNLTVGASGSAVALGPVARTVSDSGAGPGGDRRSGRDSTPGVTGHYRRTASAFAPPSRSTDWRGITVYPVPSTRRAADPAGISQRRSTEAAFALAEQGATIGNLTGPDLSGFDLSGFERWDGVRERLRGPLGHRGGATLALLVEAVLSFPVRSPGGGRRWARADWVAAAGTSGEAFDSGGRLLGIVLHPITPDHRAVRRHREPGHRGLRRHRPPGLPIGVQVAAARGRDALTLAAAQVLEERFGAR